MFVKCVKAWRVKDNKIVEFEYIIVTKKCSQILGVFLNKNIKVTADN